MIRLTPTFITEYSNLSKGIPGPDDTTIFIPIVTPNGKKVTVAYENKRIFNNPVFPVELYEYRRGKNMKLPIDGEVLSLFVEGKETLQKIFIKVMP